MLVCARCGKENPDEARFCLSCGAPFEEAAPAREERKVVTVLFCDLVGSTAQAERSDPEDVRALLSRYHERVRSELERHGGTVEKFIGDAVMALFGAPIAHEDDPERAVRAALAIREWAPGEGNLSVRIGITTGEALVSLSARPQAGEGMASGDVVNTAARLQSAAPAGGILVDETTYRATERAISYRARPPVEAKGKSETVPVWLAVEAKARFGIDVRQIGSTPLVGRNRELDQLWDALQRAREEREPQLVTLVGVPGIGKSRLVWELFQRLDQEPHITLWRQGRSLPYGEGTAFWALAEIVKAQAGILEDDGSAEAAAKLERVVHDVVPERDRAWISAHLLELVGLATAETGAADRRNEAFAAWRRFLEELAQERLLVLVFEDLHWADDSLLEFVDELVEWSSGVPILVVCTARPELLARRPSWGGGKTNALTLNLSPLSDEDTATLVHRLLERSVLAADAQAALLARAGGNPLYAEEFVRMIGERGLRSGDPEALPESVQGIIAARLDALGLEEKRLLQDAAVVGKVFWPGALAAIGERDPRATEAMLHALERREFIRRERRSSMADETEYAFRHVLVRDVAYGQIPRAERAERHRRAAEWIESLGRSEDKLELLAHHYVTALEFARAAGQATEALEERARLALRDAGERALRLNAFPTAVRFYERALESWPEEDVQRPLLLFDLGRALRYSEEGGDEALSEARQAFAAAGNVELAAEADVVLSELAFSREGHEAARPFVVRASSLLRGAGASRAKGRVLAHLARLALFDADHEAVIAVGREAVRVAKEVGADDVRAHALNTVGVARAFLGDWGGVADVEQSLAIAEEIDSAPDILRGYNNLATALGWLGDFRGERRAAEGGITAAERFGAGSHARFLRGNTALSLYRAGEWDEALSAADEFLAEVEAGLPSVLEFACRAARARIWFARGGTAEALLEGELAVEAARAAAKLEEVPAVLACIAAMQLRDARAGTTREAADEILNLGRQFPLALAAPDVPLFFRRIGRADELLPLLAAAPEGYWRDAAMRIAHGDLEEVADLFTSSGEAAAEAELRLEAAGELAAAGRSGEADEQLEKALAFYRSVRATRYIREAEALLAASA